MFRYMGPVISRRKAADYRKETIINDTFGSFVRNVGGWDPSWDIPRKMYMLRPHKGHRSDRTREARAKKIEAAMKGMPERIAKYEKDLVAKKPRKDFFYYIKRMNEIAAKKAGRPVVAYASKDKNNNKKNANKKKGGKK